MHPTTHCRLPTAYCLLPTAYCLLLTAYCSPSSHRAGLRPFRHDHNLKWRRIFFAEFRQNLIGGGSGRIFNPFAQLGIPMVVPHHGHEEPLRFFFVGF